MKTEQNTVDIKISSSHSPLYKRVIKLHTTDGHDAWIAVDHIMEVVHKPRSTSTALLTRNNNRYDVVETPEVIWGRANGLL